jgi:pimeloyl-ACP methyl ester carboxylesterase
MPGDGRTDRLSGPESKHPAVIRYRTWGERPFSVVLVHGGPGAPGEMGPVARELSAARGVLEPFQAAASVRGQVDELALQLLEHADPPVVLVGYSWGAMLGVLVAAGHPSSVAKLVLIGSGPLDPADADGIMETRLGRLAPEERDELVRLQKTLNGPSALPEDLARYGDLIARADAVDPIAIESPGFGLQTEIHRRVWDEAAALRAAGYFIEQARSVACPVVVIHGASDPHPVRGIIGPLADAGISPRVHILPACGHTPWIERQARDRFFALLHREIAQPVGP